MPSYRIAAAAALSLAATVSAVPTAPAAQEPGLLPLAVELLTAPWLNTLARLQGKKWFGTAADIPGTDEATDKDYMATLTDTLIFGEITPANYMKVSGYFGDILRSI